MVDVPLITSWLKSDAKEKISLAKKQRNAKNSPIPAWLFKDEAFVDHWMEIVLHLGHERSVGFAALGEFDLTRACAKEWLTERLVEARCPQHKFELALSMHMAACAGTPDGDGEQTTRRWRIVGTSKASPAIHW